MYMLGVSARGAPYQTGGIFLVWNDGISPLGQFTICLSGSNGVMRYGTVERIWLSKCLAILVMFWSGS